MATFLELAQALRREAGVPGTGPTAITGEVEEYMRLITWIKRAWTEIQGQYPTWKFMRRSFEFTVAVDQTGITTATAAITDLKRWDASKDKSFVSWPSTDTTQKRRMQYLPQAEFEDLFATTTYPDGAPFYFTIDDYTKELKFPITTDKAYKISGHYYKTAQVLSAASDEPSISSDYHDAILYRALKMYAAHEEAVNIYADAAEKDRYWTNKLVNEQLPDLYLTSASLDSLVDE